MTRTIRIMLRYDYACIGPLELDDGLGWYDYLVSVSGRQFRPARDLVSLQGARDDLIAAGYYQRDQQRQHNGSGVPATFTETWIIRPPSPPGPAKEKAPTAATVEAPAETNEQPASIADCTTTLPNGQPKPVGWQWLRACHNCAQLPSCTNVLQRCENKSRYARQRNARAHRWPRYQGNR